MLHSNYDFFRLTMFFFYFLAIKKRPRSIHVYLMWFKLLLALKFFKPVFFLFLWFQTKENGKKWNKGNFWSTTYTVDKGTVLLFEMVANLNRTVKTICQCEGFRMSVKLTMQDHCCENCHFFYYIWDARKGRKQSWQIQCTNDKYYTTLWNYLIHCITGMKQWGKGN